MKHVCGVWPVFQRSLSSSPPKRYIQCHLHESNLCFQFLSKIRLGNQDRQLPKRLAAMLYLASLLLAAGSVIGASAELQPIKTLAGLPGAFPLALSLAAVDSQAAFDTACKTRIDPSNHPEYFVLVADETFATMNDPCFREINSKYLPRISARESEALKLLTPESYQLGCGRIRDRLHLRQTVGSSCWIRARCGRRLVWTRR